MNCQILNCAQSATVLIGRGGRYCAAHNPIPAAPPLPVISSAFKSILRDLDRQTVHRSITGQAARTLLRKLGSTATLPRLGYEKDIAILETGENRYPFSSKSVVTLSHSGNGYQVRLGFYTGD